MKRAWRRCIAGILLAGGVSLPLPAADTERLGAAIELPPMMVEESTSSAPWYYVEVAGIEFLSRCKPSITRALVEAWLTRAQLLRSLIPEEFLRQSDVAPLFVLYAQGLETTVSAEIQRELRASADREERVQVATSMRLTDRDRDATIGYIDEAQFNAAGLSITASHVRHLLVGRLPELPAWVVDAIERAWPGADFVDRPITLAPFVWLNHTESSALMWDEARPRALLPANELFASASIRARENRHPRHAASRASTQELFFRWAMVTGGATRNAYWKFVRLAADGAVTEEMFEECFGFDYAELRDRLSDYLPKAVDQTARVDPGILPPLPRFDVERATPNQIARLRGEWERLAIGHVQRRLPQVREPYIAQARRTLRRAYDAGDRDPRLLATMGLCEIDAGNPAGAMEYLEPAAALGVVRPRAHYELARLRFLELRNRAPEAKRFRFGELAPIIFPLQRALTQAPALPEVYTMLAEAWACCETAPSTAEFAQLEAGARIFGRQPGVGLQLAAAFARHGKKAEATAMLALGAGYPTDEITAGEIARLRAEIADMPAPAGGGR